MWVRLKQQRGSAHVIEVSPGSSQLINSIRIIVHVSTSCARAVIDGCLITLIVSLTTEKISLCKQGLHRTCAKLSLTQDALKLSPGVKKNGEFVQL